MVMCHNGECRIGATIQSVLRWVKLKIKKLHKDRCDLRGNFVRLHHLPSPLGWRCSANPRATPGGFFLEMPVACEAGTGGHLAINFASERRTMPGRVMAASSASRDRAQTALVAVRIRPLAALGQDEEPGCANRPAQARGGAGKTAMKKRRVYTLARVFKAS